MHPKIEAATRAYNAAVEARDASIEAVAALPDDTTDELSAPVIATFDTAQAEVERTKANLAEQKRIFEAREATPKIDLPDESKDEKRHARENGSSKDEVTYRPDMMAEVSFFRDLLSVKRGDVAARDRLDRNREESADEYKTKTGVDYRDMQAASTQGAEFIPTVYLNDLWVSPSIAKRPFADALQKYPLPPTGTTLSIPHLSSGVTVAGRADAGTVSETDGVTASITHDVNEISGQVDIGRVAVYRSDPGLDKVIGETLVRRYNAYLDTQCLSGTGTAPQHRGIRAVTGANARSYTDASPTAAELLPVVYNAISDIATNRSGEVTASAIVMHHRRAGFLAGGLSSTFPLFQQGAYLQASGSQDGGFVNTWAGLDVILDANIGTTYGAATNEDEIYVVAMDDMYLAEGPLFSNVFEDVGSGSGLIRYQVFAYSALLSKRYPKSIAIVSGTGLTAP